MCTPTQTSLECYADAGFAGDWDPSIAEHDTSTAESEYIALSTALREIIPLMRLMKELRAAGFDLP
jgi:hypothetical protein